MKRDSILVVDFGTSNVHVNVVHVWDGQILYSKSRKYAMLSPKDGYTEINPHELWQASVQCVKEVLDIMENVELHAITFSYFGDNIMLADSHGAPLTNIILAFDVRGTEEALGEFGSRFTDEEFIGITGGTCVTFCTGPKLLWFKKHKPELFEKTSYFYTNQQWINQNLGLKPLNDYTMACRKMMFDIKSKEWSKPILSFLGIKAEQLGEVVPSTEIIGHIDKYGEIALPFTLPVIVGSHDCDCGMYGAGAGIPDSGIIGDITGTYDHLGFIEQGFVNAGTENLEAEIFSYCGPLIDTSVCLGAFPTSGAVLEWFMREILDDCSPAAYDMMWKHAEFRGDSSLMFNPHFSGNLGGIYGLGLTKTKEDLFESMIESLTFESRRILEGCKKIKKGSCDKVWVGEGAARSEKWMQLRADIWGCRVERMQNIEVSSVGAALLAAVKVELYQDIKSAARSMLHIRDSYEPSKDISDRYELKYRQYLELVSNGIKTRGGSA